MAKLRTIVIADYDPRWAQVFQNLRRAVLTVMGEMAVAVEHVGSTSVPGLAAKPIIDFVVVISSRKDLPETIRRLHLLGYEHQGDLGVTGREAFNGWAADAPRDGSGRVWPTHYLYVCARDSVELARQLAFRDYLRSHAEEAAAYGRLKRELARKFPHDIDSYGNGKKQFVEDILHKAAKP